MSVSSNSDCYLCGATNDPDASFCERCNGQILRIPAAEDDSPEQETESVADRSADLAREKLTSSDYEEAVKKPKTRRTRKGNIQDQRLSDALGLTEDISHEVESNKNEGSLVDTVVTSIPRANVSTSIPLLGTRPGVVSQASLDGRNTGRRTYVLLVLLLIFTGWFGYNTLTREPNRPDSIAFASTTTAPATTTTSTEVPRREWKSNEVEGRYKSAFVTVHFYDCSSETQQALGSIGTGNGIIATTHNVIVDSAPANADVAEVQNRTGQRRLAVLDRTADGVIIATSARQTSRNLDVTAPVTDPAAFYVGYDPETNIVTTTLTSNPDATSEIRVTAVGDVNGARVGNKDYPSTTFVDLDLRYVIDPEATLPKSPSRCETAAAMQREVPEGEEPQLEPAESSDTTSPDDASSTVDDEE